MRKFFKRVVLFLLPIVIIAYPLDRFISSNLYRTGSKHGDMPEVKEIHEGRINAEILIIGSSRAEIHFDTKILSSELQGSVYNIGISGGDWNLIRHRLEVYNRYNLKPKYLIVNIDAGTFKKVTPIYPVRPSLFPYLLFDFHSFRTYDIPIEDIILPLIRYVGHRKLVYDAINSWWKDTVIESKKFKGFFSVDQPFDDAAVKQFKEIDFSDLDISPTDFFEYMDNEFSETTVIGVHTPIFLDSMEITDILHEHNKMFAAEFKKRGWIFLDYSSGLISKNICNFYNSTHMNVHGATKFTHEFINDLKPMNLVGLFPKDQ